MENCFFCGKEFERKKPKAIYCSDKCRTYANRAKKEVMAKDLRYFIDNKNIKYKLDKELLVRLCEEMDISTNNLKPKVGLKGKVLEPQKSDKANFEVGNPIALECHIEKMDIAENNEWGGYENEKVQRRFDKIADYKQRISNLLSDRADGFSNEDKFIQIQKEIKGDFDLNELDIKDLIKNLHA